MKTCRGIGLILLVLVLFSCTREEEPLIIQAHGVTCRGASLYWLTVFPRGEDYSFKVYLNDELVAELQDTYLFELTNLDENTRYTGYVVATNQANNKSQRLLFTFKTLRNSPPDDFAVAINRISGNSISISWHIPFDPDGDPILFDLFMNDRLIRENISENAWTFEGLDALTSYSLSILAKDGYSPGVKKSIRFSTKAEGAELDYIKGKFGELEREFGIYLPSNFNQDKLPAVIFLHGAGGVVWPKMISNYFVSLAEQEGFICLMPQGRFHPGGTYGWAYDDGIDLKFINRLIDTLILELQADPERIYLAGMSNGAFMTYFLAKELESRLAAIAPIAGTLGQAKYAAYSLGKPMPLCHIHGTADSTVQVLGNPTHVSFEKILEFWIPNNRVIPAPRITELPNKVAYDNSTVTKFEYFTEDGRSGNIVYYQINNGTHSVPGIESYSNQDINAYDEIWKFFKPRRLSDK